MTLYFKLIDKTNDIYCYDGSKIDNFLHDKDVISFGEFGMIIGI